MNQKHVNKVCFKRFFVLLLAISFITLSFTSGTTISAASNIDTSKPVRLEWYTLGNGEK